jgi:light-regulated signal transduction histidine kinase (bacteriophytochrome)
MKMFASLLNKHWSKELPDEGKEVIRKITLASNRMGQLIREVLEYSKIAYSTKEFVPIDLHGVLQNVLGDLDLLLEESGTVVEYKGRLPVIEAIPLQMHQLFYNLVNNAVKFRKEGVPSRIRISAAPLSLEEVAELPDLASNEDYITISFSDDGIGFDQQFAEQIFQIFERLHSTDEYEGTGVGLALCKKIVENHRGHIIATSKDGEGAQFRVVLPVAQ